LFSQRVSDEQFRVFPTKDVPETKNLSTGHAVKMCLLEAILGFEWTDIGAHLQRRPSILSVVGKMYVYIAQVVENNAMFARLNFITQL
jgi:hypothetical protein